MEGEVASSNATKAASKSAIWGAPNDESNAEKFINENCAMHLVCSKFVMSAAKLPKRIVKVRQHIIVELDGWRRGYGARMGEREWIGRMRSENEWVWEVGFLPISSTSHFPTQTHTHSLSLSSRSTHPLSNPTPHSPIHFLKRFHSPLPRPSLLPRTSCSGLVSLAKSSFQSESHTTPSFSFLLPSSPTLILPPLHCPFSTPSPSSLPFSSTPSSPSSSPLSPHQCKVGMCSFL